MCFSVFFLLRYYDFHLPVVHFFSQPVSYILHMSALTAAMLAEPFFNPLHITLLNNMCTQTKESLNLWGSSAKTNCTRRPAEREEQTGLWGGQTCSHTRSVSRRPSSPFQFSSLHWALPWLWPISPGAKPTPAAVVFWFWLVVLLEVEGRKLVTCLTGQGTRTYTHKQTCSLSFLQAFNKSEWRCADLIDFQSHTDLQRSLHFCEGLHTRIVELCAILYLDCCRAFVATHIHFICFFFWRQPVSAWAYCPFWCRMKSRGGSSVRNCLALRMD